MEKQGNPTNVNYNYPNNNEFVNYNQYEAIQQIEKQNIEKYQKFRTRIQQFDNVTTLDAAKELAKDILRISDKDCAFRVGNAKCVVISNEDLFRISVDTPEEFICYDFAK